MACSVLLSAPRDLDSSDAPFLLERDDADFLSAMLSELTTAPGRDRLKNTRAAVRHDEQTLKLFPPIQRRFHLALVEAACAEPGRPRLDPARVESAGMVVRRLTSDDAVEGWLRGGGVIQGWAPVGRIGGADADPLAEVRRARADTGVPSLDRALRALAAGTDESLLDEDVVPMFAAPPDVCCAAGRTVYYGVVPTASSDVVSTDPDPGAVFAGFEPDTQAFRSHLVQPLKGDRYDFPDAPDANHRFSADWLEALLEAPPGSERHRFLLLLRQVAVEFDAFGESPESKAIRDRLDDIRLRYRLRDGERERDRRTVSAREFLEDTIGVLFDDASGSVEMPEDWPAAEPAEAAALARALSASMQRRFRSVAGRPGRYDDPGARYVVRTFLRLKPEDGCRSRTVWSAYSEPFVIAPWYESVGPPVQIALPDMADRDRLKQMRPNVAFCLPPALNALLNGNPKDLMEGKSSGAPVELGWICSFSIPVITFCAFLVLNIFLSLFDLIFRWKMFIKICVPYPKGRC